MTRQSDRLANLVGPFSRQAVALAAQRRRNSRKQMFKWPMLL